MKVPREAYQLAGVSLLALAAASTFQISGAAACSATASGTATTVGSGISAVTTFETTSVTVKCTTTGTVQDINGAFTTGFEGYEGQDISSSTVVVNDYDGNGNDIVNIVGGILDNITPTPNVTGLPPITSEVTISLDPGAGTVQLLGGNDQFEMSYGDFDGEPFAPNVMANLNTGAGDDKVVIQVGSIQDIDLGEGNNSLEMTGGEIDGSVIGGDGIDTITIGNDTSVTDGNSGVVTGSVFTNGGADIVTIKNGAIVYGDSEGGDAIGLGNGDDQFTMTGGILDGSLSGDGGNDTLEISGGTIHSYVTGNAGDDHITINGNAVVDLYVDGDIGNDTITVGGKAIIGGSIFGNEGNDTVNINGGTIGTTAAPRIVDLGDGADIFNMTAGRVTGSVFGDGGGNTYDVSGGRIDGSIFAGSQNDKVTISGNASIGIDLGEGGDGIDSVGLEDGDDSFLMTGGTLGGAVSGGAGNDTIDFRGGSITGFIEGNDGNDRIFIAGGNLTGEVIGDLGDDLIVISGGTVSGPVSANDGNDTFNMTGGTVGGSVSGGDGNDTLNIGGGTIGGSLTGDNGDDVITVSGGAVAGNITGGAGFDNVSVVGGTITGGINAEHVHLSGGTIGGDVTGIGPNTLIIDNVGAVDPLNLRDGVLFSGTGANGTVTATDLAAGGKSQNFTGFDNFSANASTLRFSGGTQGINQLNLGNGSTLFINGNVAMPGSIIATNSLINMTDGAANDVLTLGGLTLNGGSISLDINQQTLQSDQLVANAFSATGANTIIVNLLGTPQFAQATDIPLIVSASGPIAGTFNVQGIPGTPGSLFTYEVVVGPNGGLFLRATPANFGIAAAPTSATNAGAVAVAIDALYGINRDALESDLNLSPATGGAMVPVSSSFGVFASGQFAHTEHDGYDISGGGLNGPGPSFDANDFSAAISVDFNAAKHFQFDNEYGLNIGVFAGYASTDVSLGAFRGFDTIGEGTNKAGMFGSYALFRKSYDYVLVSASGFIGGSDVTNGVLGTTGSYDTKGYAVTGTVGHIFKLGDRARFDLRGGLLGVSFRGDSYTDSGGNEFGKSRLSFGAVKFEPGIYADYPLENSMVFSPYARTEFQQRFNYKNTTDIDTREIDFDDADFSVALSTGFNLKVSQTKTVSGEVRGKWSADSSNVGGKLGLKISF
ncbi:autotransporter [Mesorhizobium newzealandense]|uniref:Autotransporter n=1 Tax=Mesorhizobium newzealandense TaxID=1300302 RepID=A0ABW4U6I8_9HYPH